MHFKKDVKTICFITPGHISTNPRLVKEATALAALNYKVHIVFTQYNVKQISKDEAILTAYPSITFDVLNWSGNTTKSFVIKMRSGFLQKTSRKLLKLYPFLFLKEKALNRNYNWQLKRATAANADLYIAHILPALPIAVLAAKKNNKKFGFDAEDFHRYETSNDDKASNVALAAFFEEKYMPNANYLTAASPLIALEYEKILNRKIYVILNVFPEIDTNKNRKTDLDAIKLFWFSQTIGPNRGIETIIEAAAILRRKNIELHLLGKISANYKSKIQGLSNKFNLNDNFVNFHKTISPDEISNFTKQFDIGLASETAFVVNNNIALSNKIFTYCQAGLAIVASDTAAQKRLLEENPGFGELYKKNNAQSLALVLGQFCNDKVKLDDAKANSLYYSKTKFNWELEKEKFVSIIKSLNF